MFDGEKIGLLTLRGLSREGQQSGGDAAVAQKIGVAMVLHAIQRVYAEMKAEGATVDKITSRLKDEINKVRLLGELFISLSPRLEAATPSRVTLKISINNAEYSASTSASGDCSVTLLNRPMYDRFFRSKVGQFLNSNALFLFKAVNAIFAAPIDEAPLTTNKTLDRFFGIHHWQGIDIFVGFQLIRLMVFMTFAPALFLFYYAVTGDVNVVIQSASALVGLIVLFKNNDFFVPAHFVTNAFVFPINLLLEAADSIAAIFNFNIVYRMPYLTSPGPDDEAVEQEYSYFIVG
ncbi:MAG: hypothetical protein IPN19_09425 [Elusimicrobia bacterium]|nr:hypothetical protein [Elusimicrobiota bacterium]